MEKAVIANCQQMFDKATELLKVLFEQLKTVDPSILLRAYFLQTEIYFSVYRKSGHSKDVFSSILVLMF